MSNCKIVECSATWDWEIRELNGQEQSLQLTSIN